MDLRSELLKSIWYAFTSLDVEKCGKVSKSQLKVSRKVCCHFKIRKLRPSCVHWTAQKQPVTVYLTYSSVYFSLSLTEVKPDLVRF